MDEKKRALALRLARLASAARRSQDGARDAEAARDAAIADAEAEGWSLADIMRAVSLSRAHVHRILIAQAARQQEQPESD